MEWECEPHLQTLHARKVMNKPLICLRPVESVRRLLLIARNTTYNGFPVVWDDRIGVEFNEPAKSEQDSGNETSQVPDRSEGAIGGSGARKMDREGSSSSSSSSSGMSDGRKNSTVLQMDTEHNNIKDTILSNRKNSIVSPDGGRTENIDKEIDYIEESIDMMFDIDPFVLRDYYINLNADPNIVSEEVKSQLLTDSCIGRFEKDRSGNSNTNNDTSPILVEVEEENADGEEERSSSNPESTTHWHQLSATDREMIESRTTNELQGVTGTLCGLMLRSQIMVLLKHKVRVFVRIYR